MLSEDALDAGRYHTAITYAFSHRDPWHLGSNMVTLYFFGQARQRH